MMAMDQTSLSVPIDSIGDHRSDLSDANSFDSAFSVENGVVSNCDQSETKLLNELQRIKEDLKNKDNEIQRVYEMRENSDREIQDLTAFLFESAHSMVDEAKSAQVTAEQKLKTANETVEALRLENAQLKKTVSELKEIINNSRSSMILNRAIVPSSAELQPTSSIRQIVREKLHKRSSSDLQHSLSTMDSSEGKVDNVLFREFARWEQSPSLGKDSSALMHRIYGEDISPCLTFPNSDLSSKILDAIEQNNVTMETCHSRSIDANLKVCSLTGDLCQCDFRIRLEENGQWYPLSSLSRNRIVAVCEFFTYVRHVQSGLVKSDTRNRYKKIIELRKQMAFARLGL